MALLTSNARRGRSGGTLVGMNNPNERAPSRTGVSGGTLIRLDDPKEKAPLGRSPVGPATTASTAEAYTQAQQKPATGYTPSTIGSVEKADTSKYEATTADASLLNPSDSKGYDPQGYQVEKAKADKAENGTLAPASTYKSAKVTPTTYNAYTKNVESNDLASYHLNNLLDQGGSYLTRARTQGEQYANRRGILNTGIAADMSVGGAIDRALPIAAQDAQTFNNRALANMNAINASRAFNAGQLNAAAMYNAQAQDAASRYNADSKNQFALTDFTEGNTTARQNASMGTNVNLANSALQTGAYADAAKWANEAQKYSADMFNQIQQMNQQYDNTFALQNMNAINSANSQNAQAANSNNQFNASQQNTATATDANAWNRANEFDIANVLSVFENQNQRIHELGLEDKKTENLILRANVDSENRLKENSQSISANLQGMYNTLIGNITTNFSDQIADIQNNPSITDKSSAIFNLTGGYVGPDGSIRKEDGSYYTADDEGVTYQKGQREQDMELITGVFKNSAYWGESWIDPYFDNMGEG